MRIIAGKYKNKVLKSPKNDAIRPTMDRCKEALFNIINFDLIDKDFLDLFGGSANISCEAISRGCNKVVCVDNDYQSIKLINENNKLVDNKITVVKSDVIQFIKTTNQQFDFIFLDPPYNINKTILLSIIDLIFTNNILKKRGIIILEVFKNVDIQHHNIYNERNYGITKFYFLRSDDE